jgi:protein-tyrosine phosphatase
VLFRSGNLAGLDDAGATRSSVSACAASSTCAPTTRSPSNRAASRSRPRDDPDPAVPRLRRILLRRGRSLADVYRGLVDESADRMVAVVRAVLAGAPALVHCTVGKDRTGVAVALCWTPSASSMTRSSPITRAPKPCFRRGAMLACSPICAACTPTRATSKTSRHARRHP